MSYRWLGGGLLILLALGTVGCEQKEGNADSVSGSGVEINCQEGRRLGLAAVPNEGVGDTRTDVTCLARRP